MRILITGSSGFIGSHLTEYLLQTGQYKVYGLDLQPKLSLFDKYSEFHFFQEDVCTTQVVPRIRPHVVVHLAAMAGVRKSIEYPEKFMYNNVYGHTYLMKECMHHGVKRFIYASSSSVYGCRNDNKAFQETDNLGEIVSPYALSKSTCENMTRLLDHLTDMECIGLRFFSVYGPRGRTDMAPFHFSHKIMHREPILCLGDGSQKRDFTYVGDIVKGICAIIENPKKLSSVYNIGYGQPVSITSLIKYIEEILQMQAIVIYAPRSPMDVPVTFCDNAKLETDTGFKPRVSLREGLEKMIEWMKTHYSH